jgi:hypothetical protein
MFRCVRSYDQISLETLNLEHYFYSFKVTPKNFSFFFFFFLWCFVMFFFFFFFLLKRLMNTYFPVVLKSKLSVILLFAVMMRFSELYLVFMQSVRFVIHI